MKLECLFERSLRTLIVVGILTSVTLSVPYVVKAAPVPVTGYAWSSEMGWISFNGLGYGVFEESTNGDLSGYAWSSNIGWISFNASQVSGCPSGTCTPNVNSTGGALRGWARACAAFINKTSCSGALDPNAGGWDGWIALKGAAQDGSTYGVVQDSTSCAWSGYAWGSDALGAINMSGTSSDGSAYGVVSGSCAALPPTAVLTATPSTINAGDSTTLTWSSTNATSCTAAGGFSTANAANNLAPGVVVTPATTSSYSITCTGAGGSANSTATVTVNVSGGSTVSIDATPDRLRGGGTTHVTWSGTGVNACHIDRNNVNNWQILPGGASQTISGFADDVITERTVYVLACNTGATATKIVNLLPSFIEF